MNELIDKINAIIEGRLLPMDLTDEEFKAIRALIENGDKGPEVDEGFVEKWTVELGLLNDAHNQAVVRTMLREAGVEVEEKK